MGKKILFMEFMIVIFFIIIGLIFKIDYKLLIFLSTIAILLFFPAIIKFNNKFESDLFFYKYSSPLILGILISLIILIFSLEEIQWFILLWIVTFILIYFTINWYMLKTHPKYYLKS